jgi:hypothetical protein
MAYEARDILEEVVGRYVTPEGGGCNIELYSYPNGTDAALSQEQAEELMTKIWNRMIELSATETAQGP